MNTRHTILSLLLLTAFVRPLAAQPAPDWDRRAAGISTALDPTTGLRRIAGHASLRSASPADPDDLSTELLILVNGTTVHSEVFDITSGPLANCPGGCPEGSKCYCVTTDGFTACWCHETTIKAESDPVPLEPGDEIMVLLRPAPGAVPDDDASNDQRIAQWTGSELYWSRHVRIAQIVPSSAPAGTGAAGDQFFDVWVEVGVEGNNEGPLPLQGEIDLLVNGALLETLPVPFFEDDLVWNQCGGCDLTACVLNPVDGTFGTCQPDDDGPLPCSCQYQPVPDIVFPVLPVDPGDEIVVILRPAPGALPELPGFPDDDEDTGEVPSPCPGDTNGDTFVDVQDLVNVVLDWGTDGAAHGGDVNFDGIVDVSDLVVVVLEWGPCVPM